MSFPLFFLSLFVTFWLLFCYFRVDPQSHFFATFSLLWIFRGFGALWDLLPLTSQGVVRVPKLRRRVLSLDGWNRAIVIAESRARVIAAIRITSVRWRSYLPLKTQNLVLVDPAFVALRFEAICSMWACGMACESWPRSLNTCNWRLAIWPIPRYRRPG